MDLAGQVAVVTGGGRGIGRATALALAGAGAGVCVCARTAEEIEAVADEVRRLGRPALAVPCDVADAAQVQALAERTIATLGRADILVNNAGGGEEKNKVGADDVDRWRQDRRGQSRWPLPGDARVSAAHHRRRRGQDHQHRLGNGARTGAR